MRMGTFVSAVYKVIRADLLPATHLLVLIYSKRIKFSKVHQVKPR